MFRSRRVIASVGLCSAIALSGLALVGGCVNEVKAPPPAPRYTEAPAATGLTAFMEGTIHQRAIMTNTEPYNVSSYGLVGQLRGTGDSTASNPVRQYMVKEMVRRGFGDANRPGFEHVSATDVLRDPNYAIVRVDAFIPAGARKDDFIDAQISCLTGNKTSSLVHGVLFETDLKNGGADIDNPAGAVNTFVRAKGAIMVNPAYALDNPNSANAQARGSLRNGIVMFNARVMQDRPLMLRLRQPQLSMSRIIEDAVRYRFQENFVAQAMDEGIVNLYVPNSFRGDWEHFSEVVKHMYVRYDTEFQVARAQQLVEAAVQPGAPLEDISYCLEGIGTHALAPSLPLLNHPDPRVAFYIARAAANIGDGSGAAQNRLVQMARASGHPFQLLAVKALGSLPPSSALNNLVHPLLNSELMTVRIETYRILAKNRDATIISVPIAPTRNPENQKFLLDVVPCDGPPIVYVSRSGKPRIAILGQKPMLNLQEPITIMDNRLTIAGQDRGRYGVIFFRDPMVQTPVKVMTQLTLDRFIARLAGMSPDDAEPLNFSYSEIAGILQVLVKERRLESVDARGQTALASFLMQDPPRVEEDLIGARMAEAPGTPSTGSTAPRIEGPAIPVTSPTPIGVANPNGPTAPPSPGTSNAPKF